MWSDTVTLIAQTPGRDADGFPVVEETATPNIPCNITGVVRSEFYAANAAGIRADITFELMRANYAGQRILMDERTGQRYSFVRSYPTHGGERLEITATELTEERADG